MRGERIMNWKATLFLIVACAFHPGCHEQPTPEDALREAPPRQLTVDEVKTIGQRFLDENAPLWTDEYKLPSTVIDHGDFWEYTFLLPAGTLGGTPVVYIDKRTLQVTKMFHEQ
jgi:hypothetical protein